MSKPVGQWTRPDYGIDAPAVMRNLFVLGAACLLLSVFFPHTVRLGQVEFQLRGMFGWVAGFLLVEACLFLLYVKYGKMRHRDLMLSLRNWRGDEQVLDIGCGRGLLLAGMAKKLTTGHATGIDLWSNEDMGDNSEVATLRNLALEGVTARCTLVTGAAQQMPFADASFDVIVSNLCLHNIYDKPTRIKALHEIVRVLKPGGLALISDYKLTTEYMAEFRETGLMVRRRRGSVSTTFPPLRIVVAHKLI